MIFLIYSSGSPFVLEQQNHLYSMVEGIMRNSSVKLI